MRLRITLLAAAATLALGASSQCFVASRDVLLEEPGSMALVLHDEVHVAGRVGRAYAPTTIEVSLDGVGLASALGVTPPFTGAGGSVAIGSDLVSISAFDVELGPQGRFYFVSLDADGLPDGEHLVELSAARPDGEPGHEAALFTLAPAPSQLRAEILPAGAHAPASLASGFLVGATLGDPTAAPPIPLSGGGALRSGFVEVAEALVGAE